MHLCKYITYRENWLPAAFGQLRRRACGKNRLKMSKTNPRKNLAETKNINFCNRVFIKFCVFSDLKKNIPDSSLSLFSLGVSVCTVYTHQAGRKPALQQNWQSSE